jgi:Lar family restriction alleviation protein
MTITEPIPCPFCGATEDKLTVDSDIEAVVCDGCTATGPSMLQAEHESEEAMLTAAIEAWNARSAQ